MKLSEYFELVKPQYVFLKITPDKSIRNYDSTNIAKAISHTYTSISRRIRIEQRKLFFETSFKIAYIIDIKGNNADFYFMVPKPFANIILEKVAEIWPKSKVELVEGIAPFNAASTTYQVVYKREDAFSVQTDRRSNEPLNSILNVIEIMQDQDRVTIVYNFLPRSQFGWLKQYNDTMRKFKNHAPVDKQKLTAAYVSKLIFISLLDLIESIMEVVTDFLGAEKKKENPYTLADSLAIALENVKELANETRKKKDQRVIDVQVAVVSHSVDHTRQENNAIAVCQGYRVLDGDNELIGRKVKKAPDINSYRLQNIDVNVASVDECQNFLQVPGRSLLKQFNLQHISVNENAVPNELQHGYIQLGKVSCKETKTIAYLEDNYDSGNLPLLLIGAQGSGKTTFIASNYCRYVHGRKEGTLVLDFIKNCELSDNICMSIPRNDRVVLDLSKQEDVQGFGFNEIKLIEDMDAYTRLKLANLQAQQTLALVDAINPAAPLSSQMRRYLAAACNVVYSIGYTSIRDVISCLEDHRRRHNILKSIPDELQDYLRDEVDDLTGMDDVDKKTGEIIGTKSSKVEFIMDRINLLKEDFKLKYMFNKPTTDNIDLVELMEQGKTVIIKMPQDEFPTRTVKNILITYWVCKKWLSDQIRGGMSQRPKRTHTIIDEVFQAPTSMGMLEYILPQSRKFGSKFVLSTQYIDQVKPIEDSLKASGCSYMLLKGVKESDFDKLKNDLDGFEYEDLKDMEQYSSLNLVYYSSGYASFISKLPSPTTMY